MRRSPANLSLEILSLTLFLVACGGALPSQPLPDAGVVTDAGSLADAFDAGTFDAQLHARPSGAGIRLRHFGDVHYVLQISRDEQRREQRRLVAYDASGERWVREEAGGERLQDFAVHPSGELTVSLERRTGRADRFDLVRLAADGTELDRTLLSRPAKMPAADLAPTLPASPFMMRGVEGTSVVRGWAPWVALEARGEGVVIGLVSYVDNGGESALDNAALSAVISLSRTATGFSEDWSRMVDGLHGLIAVAWQYDEFLWLDAATRMLVRLDDNGDVLVGRTLSGARCFEIVARFSELSALRCRQLRDHGSAHRYQPFAVTRFSPGGERLGTEVFAPESYEELVIFDMAVRSGKIAIAGTAVKLNPETGSPDYYVDQGTAMSPYDGVVATLDGAVVQHVDLGRGELLSALQFTAGGLLAAGGSGWNRWTGGMSVSRGAQPLLVHVPLDGSAVQTRVLEGAGGGDRHAHVLALDSDGRSVWAAGPNDAPMTHSGDASPEPMALGGFTLQLR